MAYSVSDHAKLAKSAYFDNDRALTMAKEVDPDFELDPEYSATHYKTYVNKKTNKVYSAFRGTDPKDNDDHEANTLHLIGAGAYSKRFKKGHQVVKGLVNKYTKDNVAVVGHSLGGNIASAVSKKHDIEATTFSRGKGLTPNIVGKKEKAYRTYGDKLSDGGNLVIPKKLNIHSIDNFV